MRIKDTDAEVGARAWLGDAEVYVWERVRFTDADVHAHVVCMQLSGSCVRKRAHLWGFVVADDFQPTTAE